MRRILLFVVLCVGCDKSIPSPDTVASPIFPALAPGTIAYLSDWHAGKTPVTTDPAAYRFMLRSDAVRDTEGWVELGERLLILPAQTKVRVLGVVKGISDNGSSDGYEVRLLEGKHEGKRVYLRRELLQSKP